MNMKIKRCLGAMNDLVLRLFVALIFSMLMVLNRLKILKIWVMLLGIDCGGGSIRYTISGFRKS